MRYLTIAMAVAALACSSPTAPTRALTPPDRPSLDADKGSCNPNDDVKNNHCSNGGPHNPGNSNPNP